MVRLITENAFELKSVRISAMNQITVAVHMGIAFSFVIIIQRGRR